MSETGEPTERALANLRDALAALNKVPAAGVSGEQHTLLIDASDNVVALESALQNEVEQQRGSDDDDVERVEVGEKRNGD